MTAASEDGSGAMLGDSGCAAGVASGTTRRTTGGTVTGSAGGADVDLLALS